MPEKSKEAVVSTERVGGETVYSVVIPVFYRNAESLPAVIESLEWLQRQLDGAVEAVFVVDGSPDDSADVLLRTLPLAGFRSQLLLHARNFGAFSAIRTGLVAANGQFSAVMAADLQEPIQLVLDFFMALDTRQWDIVVGTRVSRNDPALTRATSALYWSVYRRFVQPQMPAGGVDVFACTRDVAQKFGELEESHSSLIGLLFWLGYRRTEIPYSRLEREHGKSSWSLKKRFNYLSDSIFSFTSLPISVILAVGLVGAVAALVYALVTLIAWLAGAIAVPGFTALMIVILFATGSILLALGIVGTYVWRAYENTKGRPQSVVMRHENFIE
jgi:glycosyltransferase involved in cell wall biosynthesis